MKWDAIEGWFDFQLLYSRQVSRVSATGAHFVEIGSWMGRSTAYMGAAIRASQKSIRFDAVDTWEGSPEREHRRRIQRLAAEGKTLFDVFCHNMQACGVHDFVNPVRARSVDAAKKYPDKSLDFVFIDGDHKYDAVCEDIRAWLPKVKPGGLLAGHDYPCQDVASAVADVLVSGFRSRRPRSWVYPVRE